MSFTPAELSCCRRLVEWALEEDLGAPPGSDLTSQVLLPQEFQGQAIFASRVEGVVAGLPAARLTCALVDPQLSFEELLQDGSFVQHGTTLARVAGPMRSLLIAERTALNFLQRLSGIASLTARYVRETAGLRCKILDTRKTAPGWRLLDKYAVRQGGGHNHRLGLYDGILIKDNHLAALASLNTGGQPGIPEALGRALAFRTQHSEISRVPIEVEVDTLDQLDQVLREQTQVPDIILLDNMQPEQLREAVRRRDALAPGTLLEASGGVTLTTVRSLAETGVDRISIGALTHSAPALDIGLDYVQ